HAGVFPRPFEHLRRARGQAREVYLARLIGAVFAPHDAEDAELGEVRLTPEDGANAGVLLSRQAMLPGDLRCHSDFGIKHGTSRGLRETLSLLDGYIFGLAFAGCGTASAWGQTTGTNAGSLRLPLNRAMALARSGAD